MGLSQERLWVFFFFRWIFYCCCCFFCPSAGFYYHNLLSSFGLLSHPGNIVSNILNVTKKFLTLEFVQSVPQEVGFMTTWGYTWILSFSRWTPGNSISILVTWNLSLILAFWKANAMLLEKGVPDSVRTFFRRKTSLLVGSTGWMMTIKVYWIERSIGDLPICKILTP